MQDKQTIVDRINSLKEERNAVILVHNYCRGEVQDIADFLGDSLGLSLEAVQQDADVIVFCGVNFMAESAAILSPEKTVIIPDMDARCPMANMIDVPSLRQAKEEHPTAAVVCYVNSLAEIKAESDICCTSANAVDVVNSLDADEILFVPDKNLADYVAHHTDKTIIPWNGCCPTHDQMLLGDVLKAKSEHPAAQVMAHPECRREVLQEVDHVFSTTGMTKYATRTSCKEMIVATENGMLHRLRRDMPDKTFYPISEYSICPDMKMIDLEAVLRSLENMEYVITVPEELRVRAKHALDRMLTIKRSD
ncbi:MAG: quinolinate synthase NadA [Methanosarcinaceae archaeon]|nr:quinolinate synthase NadA [Methanosarcinaceae archaeon]